MNTTANLPTFSSIGDAIAGGPQKTVEWQNFYNLKLHEYLHEGSICWVHESMLYIIYSSPKHTIYTHLTQFDRK